jgi:hypothetical protein
MKRYPRKGELPLNKQYVLAYFPDRPWLDLTSKEDFHKLRIVKFVEGISEECRKSLKDSDRKKQYYPEDEYGNNKVAYYWTEFGPTSFFGQECEWWIDLENIIK